MKEKLAVVLEQLKTAKIQVSQRTLRKQVNLFEYDDSPDIEFNGHRSLPSLQEHLFTFYTPIKQHVDAMVQSADMQPHSLKKDFDLACFEIREFRQRYFPKDNYDVLFHRVELHKSTPLELTKDEGIKKNPELFSCPVQAPGNFRRIIPSSHPSHQQILPNKYSSCHPRSGSTYQTRDFSLPLRTALTLSQRQRFNAHSMETRKG